MPTIRSKARAAARRHPARGLARPQPALLVAVIALVAALAGSASALPGKNTVDRNDVKKNAIAAKQIKNDAVGGAEIGDGAVGAAEIADGSIGAAELGAAEPFHLVGEVGEVPFFDGGEGDCVWKNGVPTADGTAPAGFRRDPFGRVQMRGVASASDGTGGDKACDMTAPGEAEDGIVFILPGGYVPEYLDISGAAGQTVITPAQGAVLGTAALPGGAVVTGLDSAILDGIEYTPAAAGVARTNDPARISARQLRMLGGAR